MKKETQLIESLINEDGNFCTISSNTPLNDISSWSIDDPSPDFQSKPLERKKTLSLPPFIIRKGSRVSAEVLPKVDLIPKKEFTIQKVDSILGYIQNNTNTVLNIKNKLDENKNKQDFIGRFNEVNKIFPIKGLGNKTKLKPLRKSVNVTDEIWNEGKSGDNRVVWDYPKVNLNIGVLRKNTKKLRRKYNNGYIDKIFVDSGSIRAGGIQFDRIRNEEFVTENTSKSQENVQDFFKNIFMPTLRSRSNLAEKFIEKISARNKYFLSPIMRRDI
ncbi:hypothetical protein SteCoe_2599 [Stentor coeruleus]|uniref:Uncharacterized protein n=1 Tax=Stentor coeruleus TaxID=5963 RepID=A0A1R2CZ54_9CILI|nr:hypothetical protein SteCoe_2599 [Stentor coeruleus]